MASKNSNILVLNAGSSSIKFAIFDTELNEQISGIAEGIGGASSLTIVGESSQTPFIDHQSALKAVLNALETKGYATSTLAAAGHRVVHGGRKLTTPMRVNADVLAEIGQCTPLAPPSQPTQSCANHRIARTGPRSAPICQL